MIADRRQSVEVRSVDVAGGTVTAEQRNEKASDDSSEVSSNDGRDVTLGGKQTLDQRRQVDSGTLPQRVILCQLDQEWWVEVNTGTVDDGDPPDCFEQFQARRIRPPVR